MVLIFMGAIAYQNLFRLEDPEFVIKEAIVAPPYPGASPGEVEKEVTEKVEKAILKTLYLKGVLSWHGFV